MMKLTAGQIWREHASGRYALILEPEVHGTGPSYTFLDTPGSWHYCCREDFTIWNDWAFVRQIESGELSRLPA